MTRLLVAITAGLCAGFFVPAHADRLWLHAASHHTDGGEYEEVNPGIGLELDVAGPFSLELGTYSNSFGSRTNYVWGAASFLERGDWNLQAFFGTADGYHGTAFDKGDGIAAGGLAITYKRFRTVIFPTSEPVLGFSLKLVEW